tara:strand:- start:12795 stop:13814 length:1020 start_codon:yes stop_codon:yes gene_type:complete
MFKKRHLLSSKLGGQMKSPTWEATAWLKVFMGQDINTQCPDSTPLSVRLLQKPILKEDGTGYTLHEMDDDFVKKRVFTWRGPNDRYYRKGSQQYEREKRVSRQVIALLNKAREAERKRLFKIIRVEFGQGLVNLQYTDIGHVLRGHDGRILVPEWTRPISATGGQMECQGLCTPSQVDVDGQGIHQGRKVHFGLCGLMMNVNTACSTCCTHKSVNWGHGTEKDPKKRGFVQKWYQLLPETEITVSYEYTNPQANHPCRGPFCRPSHWQHVPAGATFVCKDGREIVVRGPKPGENTLYAGAFVPCEPGEAIHTPMEVWLQNNVFKQEKQKKQKKQKRYQS